MNLEQRIADALIVKADEPAMSVDVEAIQGLGRRRRRWRNGLSAIAAAGVVSALLAVVLAGYGSSRTTGPADVGGLDFGDGARAFVDAAGGTVTIGGREIPMAAVPGLAETARATPMGVLYITPDQEVRLLAESGRQTVLGAPEGKAPPGFEPSIGFDMAEEAAVWLTATEANGPVATVFDLDTREVLRQNPLHPFCSACRSPTLGGADHGLVVVKLRFRDGSWAGISWTWKSCLDGECFLTTARNSTTEWHEFLPSGQQIVDLRNRVMMIDRAPASASEELAPWGVTGLQAKDWTFVPGPPSSELSPTGSHRLARSALEPVVDGDEIPLEIPAGTTPYATFDSDGSVLVSTGTPPRQEGPTVTSVYDCTPASGTCVPIGEVSTDGPIFLAGRGFALG